jgi:hypothetical protein
MVIGASCLTGIINCQIRKENPSQTLSDVAVDFYDVRPLSFRKLTTLNEYDILYVGETVISRRGTLCGVAILWSTARSYPVGLSMDRSKNILATRKDSR